MDSKDLVSRIESELGSASSRSDATPLQPPPRVADHELIRRIGAGSYGEVWLARSATGQWRAVKSVSRARFSSDRPYEREFRGVIQFEPISRSHSGLVQVLHVGRDDTVGAFYYVMELADSEEPQGRKGEREKGGAKAEVQSAHSPAPFPPFSPASYQPRTLRSALKLRGRLRVPEAIELGVELAGALGHIHRHGLVHRDVKPSNVIFVHGQAKLADLGLVTSTDEARSFVGTEGFIPPEGPGTAKADLFALGRLLYEAVTGKDRCEFPELPSDLDAWPDREAFLEFNEVLTQLCAPEPERRYANAAEVAGDLNLILAGRSVRRANGIERRLQQARRISAMTLAGLGLLAGVAWFQQLRRQEAETRAAHEMSLRERAVSAERESRHQLYTALLEQARATLRSGELGQRVRALEAVRRAAGIRNTAELRREALAALALPDLRPESELPFDGGFTERELDPKFERIALCRGRGTVEIRTVPDKRLLATLPASTNLNCYNIMWSRDGRFLAVQRDYDTLGSRSDVEVWDLVSLKTSSSPERESTNTARRVLLIRDVRWKALAFHPNRPQLLSGGADGLIIAWDLEAGRELARGTFDATPERLIYSPDGNRTVASYQRTDGWGISVHNAADGAQLCSNVLAIRVSAVAWHPRGRWVAVTDYGGVIQLMDSRTGEMQPLGRHRAEAVNAAFDATGEYLLTGGWEREMICWDVSTRQRAFTIAKDCYVAHLRSDGLACALSTDSGMQMFTFEHPSFHRELPEPIALRQRHAAFSPNGRWLAASSDDGMAVWDLAGSGPGALAENAAGARPFWKMDGTELFASGSRNNGCFRWRVHPGANVESAPVLEPLRLRKPDGFAALSLVSNRLAWTGGRGSRITGSDDNPPEEDEWVRTVRGINGLSPDGRWLAIYAAGTPVLNVYRLPEMKHVAALTNTPRISGFSFSPSGDELAVVSRRHMEIWNTKNWERTRVATNFIGLSYVGGLFQSDGRAVWLATNLRTSGLHDAHTFEPLLPLPSGWFPLALSPDQGRLAVSVDGRRMQVWDMAKVRGYLREMGLDWTEASQ